MQDLSAMLICLCHDAIGCGVVVDENRHSSQAAPPGHVQPSKVHILAYAGPALALLGEHHDCQPSE